MDRQAMLDEYCRTRAKPLRNALAEEYLYLAQAVARRFSGRGAEHDDLSQVASIALLHALERFDCDKGLAFTTFAVPTLAGEVRNYLRDKSRAVRLPRRGGELLARVYREREAFMREHGREPTVPELSKALDVPTDNILDALEMSGAAQPLSFDAPIGEDGATLGATLGEDEASFSRIEDQDMVQSLLSKLEGSMRTVIEQRYLAGRSQREVAKQIGVSQMQVSRLERRALHLLRTATH